MASFRLPGAAQRSITAGAPESRNEAETPNRLMVGWVKRGGVIVCTGAVTAWAVLCVMTRTRARERGHPIEAVVAQC